MRLRVAEPTDAADMSRVLAEIIVATGRDRPHDPDTVLARYVRHPAGIRCTLAVDDAGVALGFQSLIRALPGNPYDVAEGWGIIGTHIAPRAHRMGVGRTLFAASRAAAEAAGLIAIDAYIGANNPTAQHYYEAMGFRTYREPQGIVQKMFPLRAGGAPT